MSYGVIASKAAHVSVEFTVPGAGTRTDQSLERFHNAWGVRWASGRVTLTKLHLTFIANSASGGVGKIEMALDDITVVELGHGRLNRTVSFRTPSHVVHVKTTPASAFATQVATAVEAARASKVVPAGPQRRTTLPRTRL